jgi:hypothetical protein
MDEPDGMALATITITKTLTDNDVLVFVDATCPDGEDVALVDALGMIELAKDTLIRTYMGGDDEC